MSQQELLRSLVALLLDAQVPYMLTGSIVSSYQGEPRASHDIDVVVVMEPEHLDALADLFSPPRFYFDKESARQAIARESMFSVIDNIEGDTIDLWRLRNQPFDRTVFARRRQVEFEGMQVFMPQPEDTILLKLRWCAECGGLEKHLIDALRVYEVQREGLDEQHMKEWAERLGIGSLLDRVRRECEALRKPPSTDKDEETSSE